MTTNYKSNSQVEDSLARQSDVIVSTNVTLYAEYKGFFIYVVSELLLLCWVCWALAPNWILNDVFSIHYFPDKYWSNAVPAYSLIMMVYMYVALALYNTEFRTLALDDGRNFFDTYSSFANQKEGPDDDIVHDSVQYVFKIPNGVKDLPITLVNEVLYSELIPQ
ncbi:uncharacterized protein PRCAT00000215001 [Priceomyces carsonii]|uniref:uncharacterized protein n=1 Tax=Priceomyces carsonii TaxID=28549 RepID=UPI002EDB4D59|nr:unnamed protein product [Priceomyces carsonii]